MPTILTDRLTLRPPRAGDEPALVRGLDDFSVARWTGRVPHPYGMADAAAFISHCEHLPEDALVLAIELAGELIGVIGIEHGELGYWIASPHWRSGYGCEAARAVTGHAFRTMGMGELVASIHTGNEGSRRILEGLGFRETHTGDGFSKARRDWVKLVFYGLSREDWTKREERR